MGFTCVTWVETGALPFSGCACVFVCDSVCECICVRVRNRDFACACVRHMYARVVNACVCVCVCVWTVEMHDDAVYVWVCSILLLRHFDVEGVLVASPSHTTHASHSDAVHGRRRILQYVQRHRCAVGRDAR